MWIQENLGLAVLAGGSIFILIILLLREVNAWYWKINRSIELQEQQNAILKAIYKKMTNKDTPKSKEQVDKNKTPTIKKKTKSKKIENSTFYDWDEDK